jgi:DNA-binding transcriptional MerR regulator
MEKYQELWGRAQRILDSAEFTLADVVKVTGLEKGNLQHWLNRNLLTICRRHNPGIGRRRLFTGGDILKLATARYLSRLGVPFGFIESLSERVILRANNIVMGAVERKSLFYLIFPTDDNWLAYGQYNDDGPQEPIEEAEPIAVIVFQVDDLINETLTAIEALITDEGELLNQERTTENE